MHPGLPTLGVTFGGWLSPVRAHFVIRQRALGDYAALFCPLSINLSKRFLDLLSFVISCDTIAFLFALRIDTTLKIR